MNISPAKTPSMASRGSIIFANMIGTVLVHVGESDIKTVFDVHEQLLVKESAFFSTALTFDPEIFKPEKIVLPDAYSATAFESFCRWLYRQPNAIPTNTSDKDCVHAYLLGKFLGIPKFVKVHENLLKFRFPGASISEQLSTLENFLQTPKSRNFVRTVFIDNFINELRKNHTSKASSLLSASNIHSIFAPTSSGNASKPDTPFAKDDTPQPTTSPFANPARNSNRIDCTTNETQLRNTERLDCCPNCKGGGSYDVVRNVCGTCGSPYVEPANATVFGERLRKGDGLFKDFGIDSATDIFPSQGPPKLLKNTSATAASDLSFGQKPAVQPPSTLFGDSNSSKKTWTGFGSKETSEIALFQQDSKPSRTNDCINQTSAALSGTPAKQAAAPKNPLQSQPPCIGLNPHWTPPQPFDETGFNPFIHYQEYDSSQRTAVLFQSINAHPGYEKVSPEELRLGDYSAGRRPNSTSIQPKDHRQMNPLFASFNLGEPSSSSTISRQNPLFTPPQPSTMFQQSRDKKSNANSFAAEPLGTEASKGLEKPKELQISVGTIEAMQAQLNALTETLTRYVIDNDQRLQKLERPPEVAADQRTEEKNAVEITAVDTPVKETSADTATEEKVNPRIKSLSEEEGNVQTAASSPVLVPTPSTSRSRSLSMDSMVFLCPDESDDENGVL